MLSSETQSRNRQVRREHGYDVAQKDSTRVESHRSMGAAEGLNASVEVRKTYDSIVLKLLDFGAMLHISQIANERVNAVADYLKEG